MRIAMFLTWEGITPKQYNEVRKLVDWDNNIPAGGVLHIASFDSKGLRITDVWENETDFNNFAQNRLMPKVLQLGITSAPTIEVYPLHNLFTPGFGK
ncbi:MAG: hypothetical protein KGJ59_10075 [Bacteroidota bacterium]|nr:hypothetical protein [Bacteroidota bacterium]